MARAGRGEAESPRVDEPAVLDDSDCQAGSSPIVDLFACDLIDPIGQLRAQGRRLMARGKKKLTQTKLHMNLKKQGKYRNKFF